ncbi:MAG: transaldolase family protein, partial [Novosphingobium sp.]
MKFFADTAEIAEIKDLAATGLLDGVTTNPSLIAKSGRDFIEVTREICGLTSGPVSAEVVALDHEGMMREAEILRKIADNVCIKVPLTIDGLKTCKALTIDGTMVNVTLCFSANQALLAAKAGASFISPFVGRHDDNGFDGMQLISDIRLIYDNYAFETEILRKIADNVCIKVPLTIDGLKTCKALTSDGTMVNVTLCFSANQALLAAKAG